MPDLQTAMQKILQAWEEPETTQQPETAKETIVFKPTTNTSRTCFNIVRDNPYKTKREYVKLLEQQGFKSSSTSSLISQMTRQGLLSVDDMGLMHSNQTEYSPLKAVKVFKAKKANPVKTSKLRTSREPSKEALAAAAEAMSSIGMNGLMDLPIRSNIEVILDDISLSDAHELYRKLHQYFGGLPK
jgi:hypothetical protein